MSYEDSLKSITLNADASISGFTGVSGLASGGGPSGTFKISSITTSTINTATAHGLSIGDVVYVSGATTAGNNGGFTVATITSATAFTTGFTYTAQAGAGGSVVKTNINKQYRFVKVTGVKQAGLSTAATDFITGVLQNKPQQIGAAAQIGYQGISKVVTGTAVTSTAITAGDYVVSDTLGGAAKWVADASYTTTPKVIAGVALASSSTPGEVIPVLLNVR
jgi:hypothetical protein